ncbi:hypothetical protein pb186bvf_005450 [Paramecium bursaria]
MEHQPLQSISNLESFSTRKLKSPYKSEKDDFRQMQYQPIQYDRKISKEQFQDPNLKNSVDHQYLKKDGPNATDYLKPQHERIMGKFEHAYQDKRHSQQELADKKNPYAPQVTRIQPPSDIRLEQSMLPRGYEKQEPKQYMDEFRQATEQRTPYAKQSEGFTRNNYTDQRPINGKQSLTEHQRPEFKYERQEQRRQQVPPQGPQQGEKLVYQDRQFTAGKFPYGAQESTLQRPNFDRLENGNYERSFQERNPERGFEARRPGHEEGIDYGQKISSEIGRPGQDLRRPDQGRPTQERPGFDQGRLGQDRPNFEQNSRFGKEGGRFGQEAGRPGIENLRQGQGRPELEQGRPGFEQGRPGFEQGRPGFEQGRPGFEGRLGFEGRPGIEQERPGFGEQQRPGFELGRNLERERFQQRPGVPRNTYEGRSDRQDDRQTYLQRQPLNDDRMGYQNRPGFQERGDRKVLEREGFERYQNQNRPDFDGRFDERLEKRGGFEGRYDVRPPQERGIPERRAGYELENRQERTLQEEGRQDKNFAPRAGMDARKGLEERLGYERGAQQSYNRPQERTFQDKISHERSLMDRPSYDKIEYENRIRQDPKSSLQPPIPTRNYDQFRFNYDRQDTGLNNRSRPISSNLPERERLDDFDRSGIRRDEMNRYERNITDHKFQDQESDNRRQTTQGRLVYQAGSQQRFSQFQPQKQQGFQRTIYQNDRPSSSKLTRTPMREKETYPPQDSFQQRYQQYKQEHKEQNLKQTLSSPQYQQRDVPKRY